MQEIGELYWWVEIEISSF